MSLCIEKIVWSNEYSVGNGRMDAQHLKMARMINEIIVHHESDADDEFTSELLSSLTEYCLQHLAEEEDLLVKHGYPDFEEHLQSHNAFRQKIVQFCTASSTGLEILPTVLAYLVEWWQQHIGEEDRRYRAYLAVDEVN